MNVHEGKGYLLRTGVDTPFAAWIPASQVDSVAPWRTAPLMALRGLAEMVHVFPGGLDLLWDLPASHLHALAQENGAQFLDLMGHLPGLRLHFRDETLGDLCQGPLSVLYHSPSMPTGVIGQAWRHGWLGWVQDAPGSWSMPDTRLLKTESTEGQETLATGCIWGELVLPLGTLSHLDSSELASLLSETQARLERALSLRMNGGAWPASFAFQRRRTAWRVALLGGWEFQSAGGSWEDAASRTRELATELGKSLRSTIHVGACADLEMAHLLGHQAMREGLPWRNSLPLPPASPAFSPGFASDPRQAGSPEARAMYPSAMSGVLDTPPAVWLRVPTVPQESAVEAFLRGLHPIPAIHWLPPGASLPGPFFEDRTWAQSSAYSPLADPTQALQPSLFADLD